ncbi:TolC family protein [Pararhodonellum marinum]|uniref:TolC family protein n=1 Tax=Pararhodonellum marinum TaxID=2755358 RepID=UPI0018908C92|nr:TolC family protein [Pararhodonellum marinum]
MLQKLSLVIFMILFGSILQNLHAQTRKATLEEIISFAFENQPGARQGQLAREITDANVKSDLSGWWPQVGVFADLFRYFEQPVAIFPDFDDPTSGQFQEVRTGVPYNSNVNFTVDQPLFNNSLFLAKDQANLRRKEADQNLEIYLVDLKVDVSKAFYDVLLSQEEIKIREEDLQRQERQLKDAMALYRAGIADNIDYKRATITVQNTKSALYQAREAYQVRMAMLKELSGLPKEEQLVLEYDLDRMLENVYLDTLENVAYRNRPEVVLVQTQQSLQDAGLSYYRRMYIPEFSAFFNYNLLYQTPVGAELFNRTFPNSLIGMRFNFPIFQGGKRNHDIRAASLELQQLELEMDNIQLQVDREHQEALSNYKTNLYQLMILEGNRELAGEIYQTVSLQYEQGIKNFLEVIQAETDLQTARINYFNALFRLMASRMDLLRARGLIDTGY